MLKIINRWQHWPCDNRWQQTAKCEIAFHYSRLCKSVVPRASRKDLKCIVDVEVVKCAIKAHCRWPPATDLYSWKEKRQKSVDCQKLLTVFRHAFIQANLVHCDVAYCLLGTTGVYVMYVCRKFPAIASNLIIDLAQILGFAYEYRRSSDPHQWIYLS